jgi:serine/threonine-protein kinase PpkA
MMRVLAERRQRGQVAGAVVLVAAMALALWPGAGRGEERKALLMPGKSSLYQRILTRPGALLHESPGAAGEGVALPPLSVFFVFERRQLGAQQWLEIGSSPVGNPYGWILGDKAIDWRQTLTVAFTRTSDREATLFFRDRDTLMQLMESESLVRDVDQYRAQIKNDDIPEGFPILSIEPSTFVDPNEQFYLLPILGFDEVYLESGHVARVLNVAAVTLRAGEENLLGRGTLEPERETQGSLLENYRAGVVFVIDSTSSMGPYIDRTREAVRHIYQRLSASSWGQNLSFGLVAYRDNVEAAPGLEYVSRVVADLDDGRDEKTFFRNVDRVVPATVSSKGFNEDAYAGVYDAIESIDWRGYDGRFVIVITDAGARGAEDALSRTRLGAERLRLMAQEKDQAGGGKIAIYVLHLLTREGRHTHAGAALQYRALSQWGDTGSLYFPVAEGAVAAFGDQVDALAGSLVSQLESARAGRIIEVPEGPQVSELERKTALVGRAMQLAYLGRVMGSEAPRLIDAWVADRDFANQVRKTLEVRVLITKNQLSDLQETLQAILAAGQRTFMSEKDFFAQLRSAAVTLARDPNSVNQVQVTRLVDVGLVGEWLSDLPYKSQVMNITESRWLQRSYAEQQEVLDAIEEKILLYREIHDDADRWISLDEERSLSEAVTTIPLDALP